MSEAIMPNTRYQKMSNPENHSIFLVEHDKRIDTLEETITVIKKDSGKAKADAVHAEEISRDTQLDCRRDLQIMENKIESIKDKISGLASEQSVQILTNTIVTDKEARKHDLDDKEKKKNLRNAIILVIITGIFSLAGIWFKGEVDKTNAMFLNRIDTTLKQIESNKP